MEKFVPYSNDAEKLSELYDAIRGNGALADLLIKQCKKLKSPIDFYSLLIKSIDEQNVIDLMYYLSKNKLIFNKIKKYNGVFETPLDYAKRIAGLHIDNRTLLDKCMAKVSYGTPMTKENHIVSHLKGLGAKTYAKISK